MESNIDQKCDQLETKSVGKEYTVISKEVLPCSKSAPFVVQIPVRTLIIRNTIAIRVGFCERQ